MTNPLETLEGMASAALAKGDIPSPDRIRETLDQLSNMPMCDGIDPEQIEHLARRFEERLGVTMELGAILDDRSFTPWLDQAKANIDPYYWKRYKQLMQDKGFSTGPDGVVTKLDEITDKILSRLGNPGEKGQWDRRGMVVGNVQSGKTANYTGLICKAADAGYRLIIVIAGIHNNLRNQTQSRIDEGFVGRESVLAGRDNSSNIIGVGRYDNSKTPWTFTTAFRDFNKTGATQVGGNLKDLSVPAVFVIKKNTSTLKNLISWLKEHNARGGSQTVSAPMLLIDDEADNASINIAKGKDEVSRINGQIRELLNLFQRSCYVGYTATPFANIFIDPDEDDSMAGQDLFPKNFIVGLEAPSNYFGATRMFVNESDRFIRPIEDNEELLPIKHDKEHQIVALPESLKLAVRCFVVGRAIRIQRGAGREHMSMLVNASRFTNVQGRLRGAIHELLENIQTSVRINGAKPILSAETDPEIAMLKKAWATEYASGRESWEQIFPRLNDAAAPINAVEVNSKSSGTLNYADYKENGLNVIAVGGFSLSRGLTLEGLMTTWFLRNSVMYDTLMQMGRWFGYRPDYGDLCRIWMPEEAEGWYAHIAESSDLLKEELRAMEAAGATPEEFGLKVRSHPDTLMVTARNKMGSGQKVVVNIGLGNSFVETAILDRDPDVQARNRSAVESLVAELREAGKPVANAGEYGQGRLVRAVPVEFIKSYIGAFKNHPGSMLTDPVPVLNYIEDREHNELSQWDVLFPGVSETDDDRLEGTSLLGVKIVCQRRGVGVKSDNRTIRVTNKQRVSSRGIEKAGLPDQLIEQAEKAYLSELAGYSPDGKKPNFPDRIYRKVRTRPLLIVHLLDLRDDKTKLGDEPVVAWSISFPQTETPEEKTEYVVNTTWLRENYRDDLDEDEMEGDDD